MHVNPEYPRHLKRRAKSRSTLKLIYRSAAYGASHSGIAIGDDVCCAYIMWIPLRAVRSSAAGLTLVTSDKIALCFKFCFVAEEEDCQ
jgi:uncharacterized membrane protein